MQVSVENTSLIGRRLTITVPSAQVKSEVAQKINEVSRHKRIDGFRPGKVPKGLVEQKFGLQVRHEAISKIIETSLPSILQEKKLDPAGRPEIVEVNNADDNEKDLIYVVNLEVFPEFDLPDYSTIQVKKYDVAIQEEDIDKMIENLCEQLATWNPVERPAKNGDKLTIDYTSLINGKPYENNANQDVSVELGSNLFIAGFEEGLEGAKASETRELDLEFPQDWRVEKLAGKPVHFTITVKTVSEKQLAALDENFAKKIGATESDLASIRKKVRENLEKQVSHTIDEKLKESVLNKLLESCEVMLPKALVENEMALLHEDLHRRMGNKAMDTCHHHGLEEEANRRVTLSLILQKIVKLEKLTADNEKVREKILEIAKSFGNAEFIEKMYYESKELLSGIQNSVLVDQAINVILNKASIIQEQVTFEKLLKGQE